ncbi:hypothetical protein HOLleu_34887 [Holothuria leucospilota]|uniref:WW domain-containing protein n=1 Tax=Holothuria leucospilota TaxID=206669 RepID=A0A9Q0YQQ3_HOLLE|nr:hypothetical protein HOLleu_34887 [Holothuria leucospilota]
MYTINLTDQDIANGWEIHISRIRGQPYYFNTKTGESIWVDKTVSPGEASTPFHERPQSSDVNFSAENLTLNAHAQGRNEPTVARRESLTSEANTEPIGQESSDERNISEIFRPNTESDPNHDNATVPDGTTSKTQTETRADNHADAKQDTSINPKDCWYISEERRRRIRRFRADANEYNVAFRKDKVVNFILERRNVLVGLYDIIDSLMDLLWRIFSRMISLV